MLNRFLQFMGGRGLRPAPHIEAVARHNNFIWPNLAETAAQARVYQGSPWVYIAINRIAEAVALVPLRVLRLEGEQQVEVERHPLEVLLDAPNPYLSRFELFEQTCGMLELTGNAYWFLAGIRPASRRKSGRCARIGSALCPTRRGMCGGTCTRLMGHASRSIPPKWCISNAGIHPTIITVCPHWKRRGWL